MLLSMHRTKSGADSSLRAAMIWDARENGRPTRGYHVRPFLLWWCVTATRRRV